MWYINYIYLWKKIDPDADEDGEESDDNGAVWYIINI